MQLYALVSGSSSPINIRDGNTNLTDLVDPKVLPPKNPKLLGQSIPTDTTANKAIPTAESDGVDSLRLSTKKFPGLTESIAGIYAARVLRFPIGYRGTDKMAWSGSSSGFGGGFGGSSFGASGFSSSNLFGDSSSSPFSGVGSSSNRLGSSSSCAFGAYPSGSALDNDPQPSNPRATQRASNAVDAALRSSPLMGEERLVPWWQRLQLNESRSAEVNGSLLGRHLDPLNSISRPEGGFSSSDRLSGVSNDLEGCYQKFDCMFPSKFTETSDYGGYCSTSTSQMGQGFPTVPGSDNGINFPYIRTKNEIVEANAKDGSDNSSEWFKLNPLSWSLIKQPATTNNISIDILNWTKSPPDFKSTISGLFPRRRRRRWTLPHSLRTEPPRSKGEISRRAHTPGCSGSTPPGSSRSRLQAAISSPCGPAAPSASRPTSAPQASGLTTTQSPADYATPAVEPTLCLEPVRELRLDPGGFPELDLEFKGPEVESIERFETQGRWTKFLILWRTSAYRLLLIACWLAAITQGMCQSVMNGANLFWPAALDLDISDIANNPLATNNLIFGLINGAPFLVGAFSGFFFTDPISNKKHFGQGRRSVLILASIITIAASIGSAFVRTWYELLICRLILGIGMGSGATIVNISPPLPETYLHLHPNR
jgi:hypothetical protein